jgi:hypothetical protein
VSEPETPSVTMTVKNACDGSLRPVVIPRSRVPRIEYDFASDTGDFVPTADRHLHFATVLGGQYSFATLWNRSSAGGTDAPIGVWPDWTKSVRTAPARTEEASGGDSLDFDGSDDFVIFPWEAIPQNSGYRMFFDLLPWDTEGKVALFVSKMLLNVSIENGMLHVSAPGLKKVSTGLELPKDRWSRVMLAHLGDRLEVTVDGKAFSAPAKLPATFMSPVAFGVPLQGSGMKPFRGRLRNVVIDHACIEGTARGR